MLHRVLGILDFTTAIAFFLNTFLDDLMNYGITNNKDYKGYQIADYFHGNCINLITRINDYEYYRKTGK